MVKEERVNLQRRVMDCRHQVSLCTAPEIDGDLNELGARLEAARTALFGWKRSQGESFEELIRQEETLSREVGALLVRVDAAEREKMRAPTRQAVRTPRDTGSRPEAIQKLQDFQVFIVIFQHEKLFLLFLKVFITVLLEIVHLTPQRPAEHACSDDS